MQRWLSYHIYPLDTTDVFLARSLRPFLQQYVWPTKGARAFFIRYADEKGEHVRLRLRAAPDWAAQTLEPAVSAWFAERGSVEAVPYQPEPERFGGAEVLPWAEEYFHLSTRVVLDRLGQPTFTYGDALFDALRLHSVTAFAAGWSREKSARYFHQLCEQWMVLFFQPADDNPGWQDALRGDFEKNLAPQRDVLQENLSDLWLALESNRFDAGQPEWLRWLRGNEMILPEFGEYLEKALPSLLHLTNNRLGIRNPDEVFVNFLLARVL